ncbi:uncharacterized protein UTRI_04738_B [Ustilago trichophora]|uniref:HPP transmembrane region domain-containing protein n=1 Tax=Ustilago trichophora TaxID=86804 RepID=A0A5C3EG84_9BASI|nr:uncharacterized protein UTRI_04738_B [Ustilago trichophora]
MSRDSQDNSTAEAASIRAPTTIPEEPTPVSPASPGIPIDPLPQPEQPVKQPPAGRFIENISTDGSRASAEDEADNSAPPPTTTGETETAETSKVGRNLGRSGSNVWRRNSKKKNNAANAAGAAQPGRVEATAGGSSNDHAQQTSPTTDSSTQRASPHDSHDQNSSPSSEGGGGRHFRSFKKVKGDRSHTHNGIEEKGQNGDNDRNNNHGDGDDHDDDDDHPILAALYPLTNFIGYRPLSHPHTPPDIRLTPNHPGFNRFHYLCGRILSFGLPVSGETGQIARYRDPDTGNIHLVTMYKDQVGAKLVNSIHSLIAAWVIIALLSLVSRSPFHRAHHAPLIIGAFATEAVLSFFAYRTPLAQPKNILFGNTIAAIIGVAMEKAFVHTNYDLEGVYGVDWAAAATTVSVAIFGMQVLGFIHPPGAAIALVSLTNRKMSWWLVPIVIIGSLIVIGWALLINNVGGRRYPENWFYANAFAEPPIIGPEKLPFSNYPWQPRVQRPKRKRSTNPQQEEQEQEKGFYRVPDSGARVRHGWGVEPTLEPKPKQTAAPMAGMASHNLGGAERVKNATGWSRGDDHGDGGRSNGGGNGTEGEDGRQTRNSEVTKINSVDSEAAFAHANPITTAPTPATSAGSEPRVKSRMIETDTTVISRNNSKGSRRSRRSTTVVIHVNENRRHSTGSSSNRKVPPVPAVQWRGGL